MSDLTETLERVLQIKGSVAAALVDRSSGMCLGHVGGNGLDLELAAASATEVLRAQEQTVKSLQLQDRVEDILVVLGKHYHILRALPGDSPLFLYVILSRDLANLALTRRHIESLAAELQV